MKNRYFFITFEAVSHLRKMAVRSSMTITTEGKYPNQTKLVQTIHKGFNLSNACITGINEMTQQDYADYVFDPKKN